MVQAFEIQAEFRLRTPFGWTPTHLGSIFDGPQHPLWMSVTLQAPSHAQRLIVHDHGHLIHLAVAALTAHPAAHMNSVIEKHVVRRLVHPYPLDRIAALPASLDHCEFWTVRLDVLMAIYADLGRRDIGLRGFLDVVVAIVTG
jgi:hypothetical protein